MSIVAPRCTTNAPVDAAGRRLADGDLLGQVATGDPAAFDQLYLAHHARVFGIVVAVLRDHAQAQEVTQEVFLQLWQQADRFDPGRGSSNAWIGQVAHARAVDRVRSCMTATARDTSFTAASRRRDYDTVIEQVLHGDERAGLRDSLHKLVPLQRESIVLAYYAGMSTTQIAEQLGVNRSTIKTRIRDGLRKLAVDPHMQATTSSA